jgi:NCAIR mutase (PurE)-related protein
MSSFFKINHNFNQKNRRQRSVQIIMKEGIKHDNIYAIACMININVITFLSRSNHWIENAIRKKKRAKKAIKNSRWLLFQDQEYDEYWHSRRNQIKKLQEWQEKKKWQEIKQWKEIKKWYLKR